MSKPRRPKCFLKERAGRAKRFIGAISGRKVNAAISNSLGFGGHNAVVCFKAYSE